MLRKLKALNKSTEPKETINALYAILNIIDSKANGLLVVNSVFMSMITIALEISKSHHVVNTFPKCTMALAVSSLALLALSSALCLIILQIKWSFLENVTITDEDAIGTKEEEEALAGAIVDRTRCYGTAWVLTVAGLLILVLAFASTFVVR